MTLAVSLVAPCYNEQECLAEFHRRASAACHAAAGESYELVLVDDGSRDGTWKEILQLSELDRHVKGVRLMRNHGHQLAATAGLAVAVGERVMLIDADLQDPPELLSDMMAMMDQGADVVYGRRNTRQGEGWLKLATAATFYRILSRLTTVGIPEDTGDFRLMTRNVVSILLAMPEQHRFIRGMVSWIGGQQMPLLYERDRRVAGTTKYPFSKMIRFAADAITGFSTIPLRLASWLGLCVAVVACGLFLYTLWQWSTGQVVSGWSSMMTAISLFAGVQLVVLGIIGEYLGRLAQQSKGRPLYLIESMVVEGKRQLLPIEFSSLQRVGRESVLANLVASTEFSRAAPSSQPHFSKKPCNDVSNHPDQAAR